MDGSIDPPMESIDLFRVFEKFFLSGFLVLKLFLDS